MKTTQAQTVIEGRSRLHRILQVGEAGGRIPQRGVLKQRLVGSVAGLLRHIESDARVDRSVAGDIREVRGLRTNVVVHHGAGVKNKLAQGDGRRTLPPPSDRMSLDTT